MQQTPNDSELGLTVIGIKQDGRRRYDRQTKEALIKACLQPGVSVAGMALKHGVNANLLRKWITRYRQTHDCALQNIPRSKLADAFVPVTINGGNNAPIEKRMALHSLEDTPPACLRAQLPNGVTLALECTDRDTALVATMIETLVRCHVSS